MVFSFYSTCVSLNSLHFSLIYRLWQKFSNIYILAPPPSDLIRIRSLKKNLK